MQIVHKNTMVALLGKGDERSITDFEMFDGTETWKNETFFVIRFFSNRVELSHIAESGGTLYPEK